MEKLLRLNPLKISIFYAALATSWIVLSDLLVLRTSETSISAIQLEMLKGALFVSITTVLLFLLMRAMASQVEQRNFKHDSELRESEERFSKAFQLSPEGMSISTINGGRYLTANAAFFSMLGYPGDELTGQSSVEMGIWYDPADRAELIKQVSQGAPVLGYVTTFRSKRGSRIEVELSAEKIQLCGEFYLFMIARDLAKERELERQFQQAQKTEAVAQVAAGVAHDFKNQLMVISGYTEMLDLHREKNILARNQIRKAVSESATLARQLLAFSRREKMVPDLLDLNGAFAGLWNILLGLTGKRVTPCLDISPNLWKVYINHSQLEQIVMNLAVNALDAMENGGQFFISASNLTIQHETQLANQHETQLANITIPAADYIRLVFRDTGHGIDPALLGKIFEPFFTTKAKGKGTGLGLAAVHGIVKQSGGYISVESELGKGTTFQILLPRHEEVALSDSTNPPPTVLVPDDSNTRTSTSPERSVYSA